MSDNSQMQLTPPDELFRLVEAGLWPSAGQANQQNLKRRIAAADVSRLMPGETAICLYPGPWETFAASHERMRAKKETYGWFFEVVENSLDQIDPWQTLFVADFGPGSDSAILLDYRDNPVDPAVIGMGWSRDENEGERAVHWAPMSASFSEFVRDLKLWDLKPFDSL